jgi:hypothetical protein
MFQKYSAILAIFTLSISSMHGMMVEHTKTPKTHSFHFKEKVKKIAFDTENTLSVTSSEMVYSHNLTTGKTEISSSFDKANPSKADSSEITTETEVYKLKVFDNTLYIHNKKTNKTAYFTHGSKITRAFFDQSKNYIIVFSPAKISVISLQGMVTFSRTPDEGKLIPDEWFTDVAVSPNGSQIAMSTTKKNVHVLCINNMTLNSQKVLNGTNVQPRLTHSDSFTKNAMPWYQRWWQKLKKNRWKILGITSTSILAGIAAYKCYTWWKK